MTLAGRGPGKTAPKLQQDFLVFDPLRSHPKFNFLTDHPPPVGEPGIRGLDIGSCKHEYTTKLLQSVTPPLDFRPDGGSQYKVAVICKKCRIHADIHIGFPYAQKPCPNSDYPLHHFQRVPSADLQEQTRILSAWQCSATQCRATLKISYRLPRLEDVNILTDTDLLKRRYEQIVREDPAREGIRQATPIDPLNRLRKYIQDSLNEKNQRRTFPANNKRFMEAFGLHGQDCATLLESLGFRSGHSQNEEPQWTLPHTEPIDDRLNADGSSLREMLEDVDYELRAWMFKTALATGLVDPAASEGWSSADRDIERTLAAQGYVRYMSMRRTTVSSSESIAYFASLGAVQDFADHLVEFAFDRQIECDPANRPYYFECLQEISEQRGTESLQLKVATLASQDLVSRRDLAAAYRALNIPVHEQACEDERILNLFHVLLSDSGASAQENARQALYRIGVSRGSQRLMNASRQTLETYEDALTWLGNGVNKETPDDGLVTIVTIKLDESKDNAENAQKAISIIAKERESNFLNDWLLNFGADGQQMSPDEALRYLGIEEAFLAISQDMLPTLYANARVDRPGEQTEKAIAVLEKAASGIPSTSHPAETWPVGLRSHGNTCYLNSLLQYYFSIAPLRDIVLNYDQYKLDTAQHEEKTQRVGQRKISMVEIKGGQRFAEDLKYLFERMIKSPMNDVKPEEDLVCRAFLEPKDYALLASAVREEKVAQIPKTNTGLEVTVDETFTNEPSTMDSTSQTQEHEPDASSTTLQASIHDNSTDTPMKDGDPPLTPPASPDSENQQRQKPLPAPPLPPRRFSVSKEEALRKAQDNAKQQQDVTEVHDSIMFRLRSGMSPQGKDASEEQEDALRDLFKIGLVETAVKDGDDGVKKKLFDTSVQLNVPSEETDIYSALDAVFDLQAYDENSAGSSLETYKSIQSLPPLLQINIPRIGFDKDGRGGAYKSDKCVKLEKEIFLDRYTDAADPAILPKRKSCWGWRKQLHALRKEQKALANTATDLDGPSTIMETAKYLAELPNINRDLNEVGVDDIEVPSELQTALSDDAAHLKARLDVLKGEISQVELQLRGHFEDFKKLKYRLAAVFFHRGSYGHGHYWIYIYDFVKQMWRSYNDEKVDEFSKPGEILEARDWSHGTPTYAVYVRDEEHLDIIQPVCRAPEQLPTPESNQAPDSTWSQDMDMINGDSEAKQPLQAAANDPPRIVVEGGADDWDEKRQVPEVNW